ncbi:MAG TPA: hypothetical protein VLQ67_10305 [Arachnia sp.]|nr:hypothetical protein [Arachnia sp.]
MLEVTLVPDREAIRWQDQLAIAGGGWDVPGRWELRLHTLAMPYRSTEEAARRVVVLCDEHGVDHPGGLPAGVRAAEPSVAHMGMVGSMRRVDTGRDGLQVFVPSRADFIESTDADFALVLEGWLAIEHVRRHVAKTVVTPSASRHLFLVPLDDVLPIRFFTDDFAAPSRRPQGYDGLDGLWVWSNYWHRFLGWHDGVWTWHRFPSREERVERPVSGERPGLSF